MVQRYELTYKWGDAHMIKHDCGDYVEYEDYVKLEADFKAYKASAYTVAEQYAGVIKELEAELSGLKEWRAQVIDVALKASEEARTKIDNLEAELQKYKDQFPDYVECANCGSVTHVEGAEDTMWQSGRRKEDAQECVHKWDIDGDYMMQCVRCGKIE